MDASEYVNLTQPTIPAVVDMTTLLVFDFRFKDDGGLKL